MKTGALLSAIASLASVQVAAIPQPNNIWQRLGGILEQRQEAASSSSPTNAAPAPTLVASYAPIVSTVVETITGKAGKPNATIPAVPATTVGPSLSEDSFTTTSGFLFTRTASDGEVCVISVNRTDVYVTIYESRPHTAYVTLNGSSSSSPALYGNGTTSATALYPTGNGTASSFGVGPTGTAASPSYVNATTTTSSLSLILTTGASSGVVVVPSGTGVYANSTSSTAAFANSTSFAAPTSAPVANTTESSSVAFANSTATAAPVTSTSSAYVYANATASSSVAFANSTATAGPTSEPVASASSTHTYTNATKSSAVPAFSSASVVFVNTTSATVTERTTETLASAAVSSSTFAAFLNTTEPKTTVTLTRTQLSALSTDATSFTTFTRSFPQVTPIPATTAHASTNKAHSSEPLVIATTMTAVVTGPIVSTSLPAVVANITATVTGDRHHHHTAGHAPQPTLAPGTQYCNVQGAPLGVFYMASYYFNSNNVDVTLEGCYQFCTRSHVGCEAYAFHARDGLTGSTVCDVYSASVTHALSAIDDGVENLWFDASCGDPLKYIS